MPTALSLIQDSLEGMTVYAPGETISDADAERALIVLNDMIDSWSTESLTCFAILEQSVALTPGKSAYTIGTGGDINATRPIRLIAGPGAAYLKDTNGNKYWVNVETRASWNLIGNTDQITSNIPDTLFYDSQFPLGILNFFPVPNQGGITAFWDSYLQLAGFAALATSVTFPPGYQLAIKANLRVWLASYFKPNSFAVPQDWKDQAAGAKANIKRTNKRDNTTVFDQELLPRANATYNIYRDGF